MDRAPAPRARNGSASAIVWLATFKTWLVTGTFGSDTSRDGGRTWRAGSTPAPTMLSARFRAAATWAVGSAGRIARFNPAASKRHHILLILLRESGSEGSEAVNKKRV